MFKFHVKNIDLIPKRATDGSAGYDLKVHKVYHSGSNVYTIDTGVSLYSCEPGVVGLVALRSSLGGCLRLANGVGVIDSDYRGPIQLLVEVPEIHEDHAAAIEAWCQPGARIAQIVFVPFFKTSHEYATGHAVAERIGGFGSTGV